MSNSNDACLQRDGRTESETDGEMATGTDIDTGPTSEICAGGGGSGSGSGSGGGSGGGGSGGSKSDLETRVAVLEEFLTSRQLGGSTAPC